MKRHMERENLKQHDKRKERRKVDDFFFFFFETGRELEPMHIWRIQLGLRQTILIKMEKKGNLGNKLGQVMSLNRED